MFVIVCMCTVPFIFLLQNFLAEVPGIFQNRNFSEQFGSYVNCVNEPSVTVNPAKRGSGGAPGGQTPNRLSAGATLANGDRGCQYDFCELLLPIPRKGTFLGCSLDEHVIIGTHNETLSVAAVRVNNPDRSPRRIKSGNGGSCHRSLPRTFTVLAPVSPFPRPVRCQRQHLPQSGWSKAAVHRVRRIC